MLSPQYDDRILYIDDDNIQTLRERFPNGLHLVVGDTHGECKTLRLLMEKVRFDPMKDHVYFVGDYNAGGNLDQLLKYIARYYQEDYSVPGFHLIRGNHERELMPCYKLENLPDILVVRGKHLNFFIVHAGMVYNAFKLICEDMSNNPEKQVYAYSLRDSLVSYDAPYRQIIWSRKGLYSQKSRCHMWPYPDNLQKAKACIIHGHTPFSMMKRGDYFSYGNDNLLWKKQRIWFAEDLQSFDIDSNVKGRMDVEDLYRGLSCICLEVLDEIAEQGDGVLRRDAIRAAENFVFGMPYSPNDYTTVDGDLACVLNAAPKMKQIGISEHGKPMILD